MNRLLGVVICVILVAILIVQLFIYSTNLQIVRSMPPTLNDLMKAKDNPDRRKELLRRQSITHCYIDQPVEVKIDQPVEVNVANSPEVQIIR